MAAFFAEGCPGLIVLGRHDTGGRLCAVGRTVPLRPDVSRQVGEHLAAADPGHPFEVVRFTASWGSGDVLDVTLVRPDVVAKVSADRAVDQGVLRHPLRFRRIRLDVTAGDDVPPLGQGPVAAAG
ncbi:hypothetical protein [Streptomyces sp. NPDC048603]|uniref:hypothetical protein n=1 Tax=Streptomyces sp. NPDC048603 TaxID=3365577 RepID=UPI0037244A2E